MVVPKLRRLVFDVFFSLLVAFHFPCNFAFQKPSKLYFFVALAPRSIRFWAGFGPEESWHELRRAENSCEKSWGHEKNWENLRRAEISWGETTWHEKRGIKSWEVLSWDELRRMEKLRGAEKRRAQALLVSQYDIISIHKLCSMVFIIHVQSKSRHPCHQSQRQLDVLCVPGSGMQYWWPGTPNPNKISP